MKITDIILESQTDENILLKGLSGLAKGAKSLATKGAVKPSTVAQGKRAALKTASQQVKGMGLQGTWMGKTLRNRFYRLELKKQAAIVANAKNMAANIIGDNVLKLFYAYGVIDGVYDYYTSVGVLDEMLAKGEIDQATYDSELTTLRGQALTAVILPKVLGGLTRKTAGKAIDGVSWIVKKAGAPGSAGALKTLKDLTIKAGEAALITALSTDSGKKWLSENLSFVVFGVGSVANMTANFAAFTKSMYQVATDTVPDDVKARMGKDDGTGSAGNSDDPEGTMGRALGTGGFKDPFKGTGREVGIL
jgi:hypothetical protein